MISEAPQYRQVGALKQSFHHKNVLQGDTCACNSRKMKYFCFFAGKNNHKLHETLH